MVGHIIVAALLALAAFAIFRSRRLLRGDHRGPDAVAAYAASVSMKQIAAIFAIVAGLIAFFQWLI